MAYKRIVAKFGTSLLTAGTDRLDLHVMASLVEQVARLHRQGSEIVIVSSGAVAAGKQKLGSKVVQDIRERKDVPAKQMLASIGQARLMHAYEQLFDWHEITVAQALLTRSILAERAGYLNARNTLLGLIELGVVAVINENDVVEAKELEGVAFGDNDNLSAMVANLVDADLLVLLTNTDGLYTADPHSDPYAKLIPRVANIEEVEHLAGGAGVQGIGGMATKLDAARLATASGTAVIITNGFAPQCLLHAANGDPTGTFFPPRYDKMESRKRWLACALDAKGSIVVDEGAARAIKRRNTSLLAAGVKDIGGTFERGDLIYITDDSGQRIACGVANYDSKDVQKIKGTQSDKIATILGYEYGSEVVHRNNLALL